MLIIPPNAGHGFAALLVGTLFLYGMPYLNSISHWYALCPIWNSICHCHALFGILFLIGMPYLKLYFNSLKGRLKVLLEIVSC